MIKVIGGLFLLVILTEALITVVFCGLMLITEWRLGRIQGRSKRENDGR